jgi:Ribonuclease G/E
MKPPLIECGHCGGKGCVELGADHWLTLQKLRLLEPPIMRPSLDERGITPNAINNRLLDLESHGLIRRVGKDGKFILWEACR